MSTLLELEKEWYEQMAVMRASIAELKLPSPQNAMYGDDLDDDATSEDDVREQIWDVIDDESTSPSSEQYPGGVDDIPRASDAYDPAWLRTKCIKFAKSKPDIDAEAVQQHIFHTLSTESDEQQLQTALTDVLGLGDLDFVIELIGNRLEILKNYQKLDRLLSTLQTKSERESVVQRMSQEHKNAPLAPAFNRSEEKLPHVYGSHATRATVDLAGRKYALPPGSSRNVYEKYEQYSIPANRSAARCTDHLVHVDEMNGLCRRTFQNYQNLNRMQSLLYHTAYRTSENMLICAPTGAGKTDAAMLTILNAIAKNVSPNPNEEFDASDFTVNVSDFKIVYVAPMKALAAEITAKLSRRLQWLSIQVRELTGDMQLTKKEIAATQIIVTTPEKWDVVTRKSTGDTELVRKVQLLIIDEVHMLHDERGAVIESLVARTERQVESTQSLIRIVGLSATLPNYLDVADFLKVNRHVGLFYFDSSFRPVPLEQHFIGVRGKTGSRTARDNMDAVAFDKVKEMLLQGHQVMIFVHSRKDTVLTARMLHQRAVDNQCENLFIIETNDVTAAAAMKDLKSTKNRELRDLIPKGFGAHNAGMARADRNFVEKLFGAGGIKVLCCTATLAWGVNLPAAAVIIKGTQLYSSEAGKFVDLGILDVLQIFGRAGRPQYQDTGIGMICTTQDKLQHYLSAVTQQRPIESKFSRRLVDNLNAEVSLGTVTSVAEAVTWIGYSYLFVRMRRDPRGYGIEWTEVMEDPQLVQRRRHLVTKAARTLHNSQMIIFNERTEELRAKDIGRIASQFYVLQTSIEIFNTMMRPRASEGDLLKMISMSGEFDNIQPRDNEAAELCRLRGDKCIVPFEPGGANDQNWVKTNVLLQSHISRTRIEDFALVSDTAYVAQNAARICRALFMIALNRRWGYQCALLLSLCKSIEKQVWYSRHPFHQFELPQHILQKLDDKMPASSIDSLRDMEPGQIGDLVHNFKLGHTLAGLLDNFPTLSIESEIAPLNGDVLRIRLFLRPEFIWNDRRHGASESFWIWIEDSETSEISHHEYFILNRKRLHENHELNFTVPLPNPLPAQIYVRAISDRWLGAEAIQPISFRHLIRPDTESIYTDLLNLQPLPVTALKHPVLEEIYRQRFQFFNPMQTQIFYTLYHTASNVLLGSPTGSGKTVAAELAMWWAFREKPGSKIVYIAPMKALVRERVQDWYKRLAVPMRLKLVELTGDNTPDTRTIQHADIIITTPEKWDGISRSWQTRSYVRQVSLVIIDEVHLLGGDRGPILEIIVSRMNYIASQLESGSVRIMGMSTACANASDLANWLGVKLGNNQGLFNFRHSVRPVPLEIYIDGFPEQRGFCPLMQSMNRPTFLAIKSHSPKKPVIVFVASRRQTRLTAKDLINLCGMENNPRRFLNFSSEEDLELTLSSIKDTALREALSFGIGLHHAGLVESDRTLVEQLFASNKVQILVATSTLAWGINLPAHLVVVKGTQYFDAKLQGYKDMDLTDVLQMLGRAGRPQFDSSGVARIFTQDAKKDFYKHFLHSGFPVESSLHNVLDNHLGAEISAGSVKTKQDALDYLTWTFFFRRLHKNPTYYGLDISAEEWRDDPVKARQLANDFLTGLVEKSLESLAESDCIMAYGNGELDSTSYGKIMSYYYLSHLTVRTILSKSRATVRPSFGHVMAWVSLATEFDDLPVRHNEDLINAELAENLALSPAEYVNDLPMLDPHVKAFLLLQAHLSRIELPISDYVGDTNSVLDQSVRILQAAIDLTAELSDLESVNLLIELLQSIKSAQWPQEYRLAILPGIDGALSPGRSVSEIPTDLVALSNAPNNQRRDAAELLGVPRSLRYAFDQAMFSLPQLRIEVCDVQHDHLTVTLARKNRLLRSNAEIYAPRFPKPQTEGYFILAVREKPCEGLLALKRASWPVRSQDSKSQHNSSSDNLRRECRNTVRLPVLAQDSMVKIHVISDAYPGMSWTLANVSVPAEPPVAISVEADYEKKTQAANEHYPV